MIFKTQRWLFEIFTFNIEVRKLFANHIYQFTENLRLLPESPRWLINHGKYEKAIDILELFAKSNKKTIPPKEKMIQIMQEIQLSVST